MRDDALSRRLIEICEQLGYAESESFVTAAALGSQAGTPYVVRQAIETIGIAAVFGLAGAVKPSIARPVVYLAIARDVDQMRQIRKDVWTQGVVPFLLIVSPGRLTLCSGFEPPSERALVYDDDGTLPERIASLSAVRLRASITWQNFDVALSSSVDNRLIKAVEALNAAARKLNPELKERRNLVNAAIGRFLYLYVLIDRQILHERWLASISRNEGAARFAHSVCVDGKRSGWTADDAFRALNAVDEAINGSVFPIPEADRPLLTDAVCRLIHEVLRTGLKVQAIGGEQFDFFDVSYRVLRTETISAIYERFIAIEDEGDKVADGVFYTPPHLADHVLDLVEQTEPLTMASRIIDPAAGSGVFLVGAYRRLMERSTPQDGWSERHIHHAHAVLQRSIFGTEKHRQAANVCRFSLYLTMLDYVGRAPIERLAAAAGDVKFLPALDGNIIADNAFSLTEGNRGFTHVIGNPPWSQKGGHRSRTRTRALLRKEALTEEFASRLDKTSEPVAHGRLSDMFVWLAKKHLAAENGIIALVLPARSLVARQSRSLPHAIARAMTPVFVGNLSHLRRKLFEGAEAPAMIVVMRNRVAEETDRVAIYRPLLTSLPLGQKRDIWALFLAQADLQYVPVDDLRSGTSGWYEQTMLRTLDRRTRGALAVWARARGRTFGDFLKRSGLILVRGASPAESGVSRRRPDTDKDVGVMPITREALDGADPRYRARFCGNIILVPRSMGRAEYYALPHAFASTYLAILPQSQQEDAEFDPWLDRHHRLSEETIVSLLAYLNAPVLKYFASLFGSGHIANTGRFEPEEFLSIPCPYESVEDPAFLALGTYEAADEGIFAAMKAGDEFKAACREFRDFRDQFGNASVPDGSFAEPKPEVVSAYLKRLKAELTAALPHGAHVTIDRSPDQDTAVPSAIHLGFRGHARRRDSTPPGRFISTSVVEAYGDGHAAVIWKSASRHAWTIEQAVADAQVVIRERHDHALHHRNAAPDA